MKLTNAQLFTVPKGGIHEQYLRRVGGNHLKEVISSDGTMLCTSDGVDRVIIYRTDKNPVPFKIGASVSTTNTALKIRCCRFMHCGSDQILLIDTIAFIDVFILEDRKTKLRLLDKVKLSQPHKNLACHNFLPIFAVFNSDELALFHPKSKDTVLNFKGRFTSIITVDFHHTEPNLLVATPTAVYLIEWSHISSDSLNILEWSQHRIFKICELDRSPRTIAFVDQRRFICTFESKVQIFNSSGPLCEETLNRPPLNELYVDFEATKTIHREPDLVEEISEELDSNHLLDLRGTFKEEPLSLFNISHTQVPSILTIQNEKEQSIINPMIPPSIAGGTIGLFKISSEKLAERILYSIPELKDPDIIAVEAKRGLVAIGSNISSSIIFYDLHDIELTRKEVVDVKHIVKGLAFVADRLLVFDCRMIEPSSSTFSLSLFEKYSVELKEIIYRVEFKVTPSEVSLSQVMDAIIDFKKIFMKRMDHLEDVLSDHSTRIEFLEAKMKHRTFDHSFI